MADIVPAQLRINDDGSARLYVSNPLCTMATTPAPAGFFIWSSDPGAAF